MRATKPAGVSIAFAAVLFLFFGCDVPSGAVPSTLADEADQQAKAIMQREFENDVILFSLTPQESLKRMTDKTFLTDAARAALKTAAYARLTVIQGDVTPNEKNDGVSDAWCMKYEATATVPISTIIPTGKVDTIYAFTALKRLRVWDVQEAAYWSSYETENTKIARCNLGIVKRG